MKPKAVITCDLVNSTKLSQMDRRRLNKRLNKFIENTSIENQTEYQVFRGDSLQGLLQKPSNALKQAIYLKAFIKSFKLQGSKRTPEVDIRISIGIGKVEYYGDSILDSDGEAFHNSGRTLDSMKKKGRTIKLTWSQEEKNKEWDVILKLMEEVINKWTILSAEIVWRLIQGMGDKEIKKDLNISQPAVSLRKKHAGWDSIKNVLEYFETKNQ